MKGQAVHTLSKEERLCGKNDISRLLKDGKYGFSSLFRYCVLRDNGLEYNRFMVSVPKKSFKRAVKRNLLKRRIRESYRLLKSEYAGGCHVDILFIYSPKEVIGFKEIYSDVGNVLRRISK